MLPRRTTSLLATLLALLSLAAARSASAQVVNFQDERAPVVEIHDLWRFHTGDDPDGKLGWADSGFDDSSWKLLRSDQPWSDQGYKNYTGMAWYRFQVILPPKHPPLALYIPYISTCYQVFAGGRLIGQLGGLPPHEKVLFSGAGQFINIPNDLASGGGPLTIAIRVWLWPNFAFVGGGPQGVTRIGDASLLNQWRSLQLSDAFRSVSAQNVLLLGYLLAGFAGLGLFLLRPGEREYLWFAATEIVSAALCGWTVYFPFHVVWFQGYYALLALFVLASNICFPTFLVTLLKERKGWLYWIAVASGLIAGLSIIPGALGWISIPAWLASNILFSMPFGVCLPLLLYFAARRGSLDARLLLGPFSLGFGSRAFLLLL
jgi:sigma-B regulation protein RsbU (phosphoserine phosphatase)